jgi:hypothetical protein
VIQFCGKGDESPFWTEIFLPKTETCGFKNLFSGKLSILKENYKFDEVSDIGKKIARTIKLNA